MAGRLPPGAKRTGRRAARAAACAGVALALLDGAPRARAARLTLFHLSGARAAAPAAAACEQQPQQQHALGSWRAWPEHFAMEGGASGSHAARARSPSPLRATASHAPPTARAPPVALTHAASDGGLSRYVSRRRVQLRRQVDAADAADDAAPATSEAAAAAAAGDGAGGGGGGGAPGGRAGDRRSGSGAYGGYALPRLPARWRPALPDVAGTGLTADPAADARADPTAAAEPAGPMADPAAAAECAVGAPAALVCDRCDGGHETAQCPHFPRERPDHPDARSRPSSTQRAAEAATVLLSGARVVPQPGDGNCLFHSLAHGLGGGASALALRAEVAAFIGSHAATEISATPLHEWVWWDAGTSISAYVRRMASGGTWGGGIELAAFALMRGVHVHVFEATREAGLFKRIGYFPPSAADAPIARPIHVLYRGGAHYDALDGGSVRTLAATEAHGARAAK